MTERLAVLPAARRKGAGSEKYGHDGRLPYKTGDGKSVYALKVRDNVRTLRLEKAPAMNTVGGGGVLVRGPNAVFNLEGGNIRDNFVWIGENYELYTASNDGYVRYGEGGDRKSVV